MSRSGGLFVWAPNKHELIQTMSALSLVTELFTKVVGFFDTLRLPLLDPDGSGVHSIITAIISS